MEDDKAFWVVPIVVAIVIFVLFANAVYQGALQLDRTVEMLGNDGFEIVESDIQSPSVIIILETYEVFVAKCREIGVSTIYQEHYYFYVFSEDWELGYKFYGG